VKNIAALNFVSVIVLLLSASCREKERKKESEIECKKERVKSTDWLPLCNNLHFSPAATLKLAQEVNKCFNYLCCHPEEEESCQGFISQLYSHTNHLKPLNDIVAATF